MNSQSSIRKAIEARGESRRLSPDFTSRLMCEIRMAESRKRRREMWWSIAGYVIAAVIAVATLVYCCGDMFKGSWYKSMAVPAPDPSVMMMILILFPSASILLALDYLLRRKFIAAKRGVS